MVIGKAETEKMISMLSDKQAAEKFVEGLVKMHASASYIQDAYEEGKFDACEQLMSTLLD